MKVGSLVEYLNDKTLADIPQYKRNFVKWLPIKGEIYTVREVFKCPTTKNTLLLVYEGSIGRNASGKEYGIELCFWREIQPPMDLSGLIEETMLTTQTNSHGQEKRVLLDKGRG